MAATDKSCISVSSVDLSNISVIETVKNKMKELNELFNSTCVKKSSNSSDKQRFSAISSDILNIIEKQFGPDSHLALPRQPHNKCVIPLRQVQVRSIQFFLRLFRG